MQFTGNAFLFLFPYQLKLIGEELHLPDLFTLSRFDPPVIPHHHENEEEEHPQHNDCYAENSGDYGVRVF
jgi:hypothetical protein